MYRNRLRGGHKVGAPRSLAQPTHQTGPTYSGDNFGRQYGEPLQPHLPPPSHNPSLPQPHQETVNTNNNNNNWGLSGDGSDRSWNWGEDTWSGNNNQRQQQQHLDQQKQHYQPPHSQPHTFSQYAHPHSSHQNVTNPAENIPVSAYTNVTTTNPSHYQQSLPNTQHHQSQQEYVNGQNDQGNWDWGADSWGNEWGATDTHNNNNINSGTTKSVDYHSSDSQKHSPNPQHQQQKEYEHYQQSFNMNQQKTHHDSSQNKHHFSSTQQEQQKSEPTVGQTQQAEAPSHTQAAMSSEDDWGWGNDDWQVNGQVSEHPQLQVTQASLSQPSSAPQHDTRVTPVSHASDSTAPVSDGWPNWEENVEDKKCDSTTQGHRDENSASDTTQPSKLDERQVAEPGYEQHQQHYEEQLHNLQQQQHFKEQQLHQHLQHYQEQQQHNLQQYHNQEQQHNLQQYHNQEQQHSLEQQQQQHYHEQQHNLEQQQHCQEQQHSLEQQQQHYQEQHSLEQHQNDQKQQHNYEQQQQHYTEKPSMYDSHEHYHYQQNQSHPYHEHQHQPQYQDPHQLPQHKQEENLQESQMHHQDQQSTENKYSYQEKTSNEKEHQAEQTQHLVEQQYQNQELSHQEEQQQHQEVQASHLEQQKLTHEQNYHYSDQQWDSGWGQGDFSTVAPEGGIRTHTDTTASITEHSTLEASNYTNKTENQVEESWGKTKTEDHAAHLEGQHSISEQFEKLSVQPPAQETFAVATNSTPPVASTVQPITTQSNSCMVDNFGNDDWGDGWGDTDIPLESESQKATNTNREAVANTDLKHAGGQASAAVAPVVSDNAEISLQSPAGEDLSVKHNINNYHNNEQYSADAWDDEWDQDNVGGELLYNDTQTSHTIDSLADKIDGLNLEHNTHESKVANIPPSGDVVPQSSNYLNSESVQPGQNIEHNTSHLTQEGYYSGYPTQDLQGNNVTDTAYPAVPQPKPEMPQDSEEPTSDHFIPSSTSTPGESHPFSPSQPQDPSQHPTLPLQNTHVHATPPLQESVYNPDPIVSRIPDGASSIPEMMTAATVATGELEAGSSSGVDMQRPGVTGHNREPSQPHASTPPSSVSHLPLSSHSPGPHYPVHLPSSHTFPDRPSSNQSAHSAHSTHYPVRPPSSHTFPDRPSSNQSAHSVHSTHYPLRPPSGHTLPERPSSNQSAHSVHSTHSTHSVHTPHSTHSSHSPNSGQFPHHGHTTLSQNQEVPIQEEGETQMPNVKNQEPTHTVGDPSIDPTAPPSTHPVGPPPMSINPNALPSNYPVGPPSVTTGINPSAPPSNHPVGPPPVTMNPTAPPSNRSVGPPPVGFHGAVPSLRPRKGSPFQPPQGARSSPGPPPLHPQVFVPPQNDNIATLLDSTHQVLGTNLDTASENSEVVDQQAGISLWNSNQTVPLNVKLAVAAPPSDNPVPTQPPVSSNPIPVVVPFMVKEEKPSPSKQSSNTSVMNPPAAHSANLQAAVVKPNVQSLTTMETSSSSAVLDLSKSGRVPAENISDSNHDYSDTPNFRRMVPGESSKGASGPVAAYQGPAPVPAMPSERVVTGNDNPQPVPLVRVKQEPGEVRSPPDGPATSDLSGAGAAVVPPIRSATIGSEETKSRIFASGNSGSRSDLTGEQRGGKWERDHSRDCTGDGYRDRSRDRGSGSRDYRDDSPHSRRSYDRDERRRRWRESDDSDISDSDRRYYKSSRDSRRDRAYRDELDRYRDRPSKDDKDHGRDKRRDYRDRSKDYYRSYDDDPYYGRGDRSEPVSRSSSCESERSTGHSHHHRSHQDYYDRSSRERERDSSYSRDYYQRGPSGGAGSSGGWDPRDPRRDTRYYGQRGGGYENHPYYSAMYDQYQQYYKYYQNHPYYKEYYQQWMKQYGKAMGHQPSDSSFYDDRISIHSGRSSVNDELKKSVSRNSPRPAYDHYGYYHCQPGHHPYNSSQFMQDFHGGQGYEVPSAIYPDSSFQHLKSYPSGEISGVASVADDTVSELTPQHRMTPVLFGRPHITVRFTPGGQLVLVPPRDPREGEGAVVQLRDTQKLLQLDPVEARIVYQMKSFPGPLTISETPKDVVVRFCEQRASDAARSTSLPDRESVSLLWEYLALLVRQHGKLYGNDIAGLLLKGKDEGTGRSSGRNSTVSSGRTSPQEDVPGDASTDGGICDEQPEHHSQPPARDEMALLGKYKDMLCLGRKREALDYAIKEGLWGHALTLAYKMDSTTHTRVMAAFTASIPRTDVIHTLFQQLSGKKPEITKTYNYDQWGDWQRHLAVMVSNPTGQPQRDQASVVALGDTLMRRGRLHAAHFCYLVAGVLPGTYSEKDSKLVLVGSSHTLSFLAFATNEAIQCTEVYEYARSLDTANNSLGYLPNFQAYKFIYALRLTECGFPAEALRYCEVIAQAVVRDPEQHRSAFVSQVLDLATRLKYHDLHYQMGEGEVTDMPDPQWILDLHTALDHAKVQDASQQVMANQSNRQPLKDSSQLEHDSTQHVSSSSTPQYPSYTDSSYPTYNNNATDVYSQGPEKVQDSYQSQESYNQESYHNQKQNYPPQDVMDSSGQQGYGASQNSMETTLPNVTQQQEEEQHGPGSIPMMQPTSASAGYSYDGNYWTPNSGYQQMPQDAGGAPYLSTPQPDAPQPSSIPPSPEMSGEQPPSYQQQPSYPSWEQPTPQLPPAPAPQGIGDPSNQQGHQAPQQPSQMTAEEEAYWAEMTGKKDTQDTKRESGQERKDTRLDSKAKKVTFKATNLGESQEQVEAPPGTHESMRSPPLHNSTNSTYTPTSTDPLPQHPFPDHHHHHQFDQPDLPVNHPDRVVSLSRLPRTIPPASAPPFSSAHLRLRIPSNPLVFGGSFPIDAPISARRLGSPSAHVPPNMSPTQPRTYQVDTICCQAPNLCDEHARLGRDTEIARAEARLQAMSTQPDDQRTDATCSHNQNPHLSSPNTSVDSCQSPAPQRLCPTRLSPHRPVRTYPVDSGVEGGLVTHSDDDDDDYDYFERYDSQEEDEYDEYGRDEYGEEEYVRDEYEEEEDEGEEEEVVELKEVAKGTLADVREADDGSQLRHRTPSHNCTSANTFNNLPLPATQPTQNQDTPLLLHFPPAHSTHSSPLLPPPPPPLPPLFHPSPTHPAPDQKSSNSSADAANSEPAKKSGEEKKKTDKDGDKSGEKGGFFSSIFGWKKSKQAVLPDDKNPSIVWDEKNNKWVNVDGEEEVSTPLPPPPRIAPNAPPPASIGPISRKNRYVNTIGQSSKSAMPVMNPMLPPMPGNTPPMPTPPSSVSPQPYMMPQPLPPQQQDQSPTHQMPDHPQPIPQPQLKELPQMRRARYISESSIELEDDWPPTNVEGTLSEEGGAGGEQNSVPMMGMPPIAGAGGTPQFFNPMQFNNPGGPGPGSGGPHSRRGRRGGGYPGKR